MRFTKLLPGLAALATCISLVAAQAAPAQTVLLANDLAGSEQFTYQSNIAHLMRVVISHLHNSRDMFQCRRLRRDLEGRRPTLALLFPPASTTALLRYIHATKRFPRANNALKKVRLLALTNPKIPEPAPQLNVSVLGNADNRCIVTCNLGVGTNREQFAVNLSTIARSGTSKFFKKLEKGDGSSLVGQSGLKFYSLFLVADRVTVASKTADEDEQWVFESEADAEGFRIVKDPRGSTLGRGTKITLCDDAEAEYFDLAKLRSLMVKHAEYNAAPIYLYSATTLSPTAETPKEDSTAETDDDSEVKVEDDDEAKAEPEVPTWELVNDRPLLWVRDPKEVSDKEYENFYMKTFSASDPPLAWSHFKGDTGSTTFRALVYIPSGVPTVLAQNYLERHLNFIKVFIDVDDLPLNVGRDSLQKNKALSQIKRNLVKRIYDTFGSIASKEPEKYAELYERTGIAPKVGAIEDTKNRDRIVKLLRFETSVSNSTSLDEIVARRKVGQTQIYFIAGAGVPKEQLEKSPFVERILARGYEVLYFSDPIDEMFVNAVPTFSGLRFQDVAKDGVAFGDEDEDEKASEEDLKSTFAPLITYLKKELGQFVDKVTLSTRLTSSPCLVTASTYDYSGNMEHLIAAQNAGTSGDNFMLQFARLQKKLPRLVGEGPLWPELLSSRCWTRLKMLA
ncbi:hypothetical protein JCM10207_007012 [Rhodosporidiobolus poonsookiae]